MAPVLPPGAPAASHHAALLEDLGLVVEVEAGVALVHLPRGGVGPSLPAAQSLAVARPRVRVAESRKTAGLTIYNYNIGKSSFEQSSKCFNFILCSF